MNSELIVMTFPDQHGADTVLAAMRVMRKSPILCLGSVVVASRDPTGEITVRPGQEGVAAQEDRDMQILLALTDLILCVPGPDAIDTLMDVGMDGRFVSEITTNMKGESSALFVLAHGDETLDPGETRRALALFRGKIHQTSLPPEVEAYLSDRDSIPLEGVGSVRSCLSH